MKKQFTALMVAVLAIFAVQKTFAQTACLTDGFGEPGTLIFTSNGSTFDVSGTLYYDIFGLPNYYIVGTYDGKHLDFVAYNPNPDNCTLSADSVVFTYVSGGDGGSRYFNGQFKNSCHVQGVLTAFMQKGACPNTGPKGVGAFSTASTTSQDRSSLGNTAMLSISPNPAFSQATISYSVLASQPVTIAVYNVTGQLVKTLANSYQTGGTYTITWNLKDERGISVPQGSYFVTMRSGDNTKTQSLIVSQ